jgi:ubiquinone/menaquinone biosynthesis C-methylase UbiE
MGRPYTSSIGYPMDHFQQIYSQRETARLYEQLVAREDYHGNLFAALVEIAGLDGQRVVDMGAGTGRMTRTVGVMARHVYAFDQSAAMLDIAAETLALTGLQNWSLAVASNHALPLPDACADTTIEGWSFGHAVGWHGESWVDPMNAMLAEMRRVTKPGGTMILLETMGTGVKIPTPPTEGLATLYAWWEREHGFQHRALRTDYQFASLDEAVSLTKFFFGDELAQRVESNNLEILPECTGIWWKKI